MSESNSSDDENGYVSLPDIDAILNRLSTAVRAEELIAARKIKDLQEPANASQSATRSEMLAYLGTIETTYRNLCSSPPDVKQELRFLAAAALALSNAGRACGNTPGFDAARSLHGFASHLRAPDTVQRFVIQKHIEALRIVFSGILSPEAPSPGDRSGNNFYASVVRLSGKK